MSAAHSDLDTDVVVDLVLDLDLNLDHQARDLDRARAPRQRHRSGRVVRLQ
jgi:hypothetical protein